MPTAPVNLVPKQLDGTFALAELIASHTRISTDQWLAAEVEKRS
jgi:hypothetical protein